MSDLKAKLPSFEFGEDGLMKSVSMPDECSWWPHSGLTMHTPADHESFAEEIKINSPELLSIILMVSHLQEELFENPSDAKKTVVLTRSIVERESLYRLRERNPMSEVLIAEARTLGIDVDGLIQTAVNAGDSKFKIEDRIYDGIYRAHYLKFFPAIIEQHRQDFKTHDPLTGERRKKRLKDSDLGADWQKELLRILSPETEARYERISPLPEPFLGTNRWQQYYLMVDKEVGLVAAMGSTQGSGTRYSQGRFAHTFATLADGGYDKIKTIVIHLQSDNKLKHIESFNGFRCLPYDLSGNYPSERHTVEALFNGKLLVFDEENRKLSAV